jgi:hypothetical protein
MTDAKDLSRRRFLSAVVSTAAGSCLPLAGAAILATESTPAEAQYSRASKTEEASGPPPLVVVNAGYRMVIDSARGSIASLQSTFGADRDLLIPDHVNLPLFTIEFMDGDGTFRTVHSSQAQNIHVEKSEKDATQLVTIDFKDIDGLPVNAHVTARCPANESLTYWNLEVENGTNLWIAHVQFPVVQVPFDNSVDGDTSHILSSSGDGILAGPVTPSMAAGSWGGRDRNTPEIWRYNNYPGQWASTQLMAYYNDAGGLYLACDDATGLPKFIDPLMEDNGVTMGLGHYPGTQGPGKSILPYNVVLGTFQGDWYAAAEIYRNWASKQDFCALKLAERKDYPKWITESSPVGIAFPMRGQSDWDGPAMENPEYAPATNALQYLEKLAAGLDSPLMPIVFNWEHGGPWVQPDAFPPVGGEAAMKEFMAKAKEKGWHPVIYGDGLSWVTGQKNTNYDGMPYFREHNGEAAVVRNWDGTLLKFDLGDWRKGYMACVGTEGGRQMILEMTRKMAQFGPSVIQQFDQGPGPKACFARDHGHPPVPGPWMTAAFNGLLKDDEQAARSIDSSVAMSCEGAPPETYLEHFQIWDARVRTCPLYSFLYHEYANGHEGFYTNRVNDEALRLSVGRALVTGYMVTFTLRDKGLIEYDWDQPWSRAIPDQAAILDWTKRVNQFRAGIARDYLVFGKMLRPWKVSNLTERDFGWGMEPLVQSATWQAPDGRIGIVLANCADLGERPSVALEGDGSRKLSLYLDGDKKEEQRDLPAVLELTMQPRSLVLIEVNS